MNETTLFPNKSEFRQHVLSTLRHGITHEERFEELSSSILNNIANQLVLLDDYSARKKQLDSLKKQIEEAQTIRMFNMMYESPNYNKQFNAALNHLSLQFRLRFSKYY